MRKMLIAAALAPAHVVLAWSDGAPRALWPVWPGNAQVMPMSAAEKIAGAIDDAAAGLPYAVLLDGKGRACALWNGKMASDRLARLRARCAVPAAG